jgi:hypothetical protein
LLIIDEREQIGVRLDQRYDRFPVRSGQAARCNLIAAGNIDEV